MLFALLRALAEAWPADVARGVLLARAFGAKFADESHRARLRVEVGRLRKMLRLHSDLGVDLYGIAIILDLLERLESLESELGRRRG